MTTSRYTLALFAVLLAGLFVSYSPSLDAPFYLDSEHHLVQNSHLHVVELSAESLSTAMRLHGGGRLYRPVATLSLAVNHYVSGLSPRPYRLVNIAIHSFAAMVLFFLFLGVLGAPRVRAFLRYDQGQATSAALLAVALWALHPLHTNAVTYVIQRMASLAGLFLFLSAGAYLKARTTNGGWSWRWMALSALSFVLAIASKENAVVLVPLLVAAEFCLLERPANRSGRIALAGLWGVVGSAVLLLALAKGPWFLSYLERGYRVREFTLWERLLTEARIQLDYLLLLAVPTPRLLSLDAQVAVSRGLLAPPTTLVAVLGVVGALGLAVGVRRRNPLVSFAILWFLLAQSVESTIAPLELYFEHRLYVPSALPFLGVAVPVSALLRRRAGWPRTAAALLVAVFLAAEVAATYRRNLTWSDPVRFWQDAAAKAPEKPRPLINWAAALIDVGEYGQAEEYLRRALELGGEPGRVLLNLGMAAYRKGDQAAAAEHLGTIVERGYPQAWEARRGLATIAIRGGRLDEAHEQVDQALRVRPEDGELWNLRGTILLIRGELDEAERSLRTSLRYDPAHGKTWGTLGAVYLKRGQPEEAAALLRRAVSLAPDVAAFRQNLTLALEQAGQAR